MSFVADASFIGALLIPDEKNEDVEKRYLSTGGREFFTPQLFWYEMGNIFNNLIRRKRSGFDEILKLFPDLSAIGLITDARTGPAYTETLLRIARDYGLTVYDAAYLELAGRKKAALCTLNEGLCRAAPRYGVTLLT
jgi:predicted nucleic acid-binding protein